MSLPNRLCVWFNNRFRCWFYQRHIPITTRDKYGAQGRVCMRCGKPL